MIARRDRGPVAVQQIVEESTQQIFNYAPPSPPPPPAPMAPPGGSTVPYPHSLALPAVRASLLRPAVHAPAGLHG